MLTRYSDFTSFTSYNLKWKWSFFLETCSRRSSHGYSQTWAAIHSTKISKTNFQNSMDRFGPTGKVSRKRVHVLRWTTFPGLTGWNFGWMDRAPGHPWGIAYWSLSTGWPFNTRLTNMRVIQENEDDERTKYLMYLLHSEHGTSCQSDRLMEVKTTKNKGSI